jgi:RNA polymerase sigma factor (sigma-70 family)
MAMVASHARSVVHCFRILARHEFAGATDSKLLDLYVREMNETAFEVLVRRHGRMVLGVCQRILGNSHDAEDAFQATFLVLVRKAASIRPARMVGNWLYGVAHRTALEARRAAAKRRAKETLVAPCPPTADDTLAQLRPLLDEQLARLPDKYRAVVVLCDLQGRTRKEAAQQLGLPEGTIASRQARARGILAKRLTRQGVTLACGVLPAALAGEAVAASVPVSLIVATVRAVAAYAASPPTAAAAVSAPVAALTEGVVRAMFLRKLKITALVFVVLGLSGTGWGFFPTRASERSAVSSEGQIAQPHGKMSRTAPPKEEQARIQDNQEAPAEKQPLDQDETGQILNMLRKGFQAYQASKGKQGERPDKGALDLYGEAFHKAFPISNQDQLEQVLNMVRAGFQSLRRMENSFHDPQAELDALGEIERMIKDRKTWLQREGD